MKPTQTCESDYPAHADLISSLIEWKSLGGNSIAFKDPANSENLIDEFQALLALNTRLKTEREELLGALQDIGATAQMASMTNPEQFCEWAYNAANEALSKTNNIQKGAMI